MEPNNINSPEMPAVPQGQATERQGDFGQPEQQPAGPSPERIAPSGEQPGQSQGPVQNIPLPPPVDPAAATAAGTSAPADSAQPALGSPAVADDVDLIEKEWVVKAKQIVSEYRHDPYTQEKEVGKLQADYLKKRYGKTVKTGE